MTTEALTQLAAGLRGSLVLPGEDTYDEARKLWNGTINKRPAVIVRCGGTADVIDAVNYARNNGLKVSVRGGGHHVAGGALLDDGLTIDLSNLRSVRVDPVASTARAEGGALIADVDRECQPFNLAVPLGVFSETGIAGITLAGGVGWLRRKHGMTCDNLLSADVVLANGQLVKASATENPDLFWALRGGGWNLGVVTSFEYRAHPIEPQVAFLFVAYPMEEGRQVLEGVRKFAATAPDASGALVVIWSFPHEEPYPEEVWGKQFVGIAGPYAGPLEEGERVYQPLRELGTPLLDWSGPSTYYEVQHMFDAEYPKGRHYYWKSSYLTDLSDGAIETLLEQGRNRPSPLSSLDIWVLGGAISRVGIDETPLSQRSAPYMIGIEANWEGAENDAANTAWSRDTAAALAPFSTGASYANFEDVRDPSYAARTHGPNYQRLLEIKRKYDPDNLFGGRG